MVSHLGRYLCGKNGKRVVSPAGMTAMWSRVYFQYIKGISILLCASACGKYLAPVAVFNGIQEPRLSNGA